MKCAHCNGTYKNEKTLAAHHRSCVILAEDRLLSRADRPDYVELCAIVYDLQKKTAALQNKVTALQEVNRRKAGKINVKDWLGRNRDGHELAVWLNGHDPSSEAVQTVANGDPSGYLDGLDEAFRLCFASFKQRKNSVFVYDNESWTETTPEFWKDFALTWNRKHLDAFNDLGLTGDEYLQAVTFYMGNPLTKPEGLRSAFLKKFAVPGAVDLRKVAEYCFD